MTTATAVAPSRTLVLRHLLRKELVGLEALLGAFVVGVAIVGTLIHLFGEVTGSIWHGAIGVSHWFSLGMGVYLTAVHLPLYIAHGRTRREVAGAAAVFAVALALWLAVAITLGYAVEVGIYHLIDWAHLLPEPHPVESVGAVLTTFAERTASFLVFVSAGALAGAGFYRSPLLGMAVVLPCLGATMVAGNFAGGAPLIALDPLVPFDLESQRIALTALAALVLMAATWPIVRDMPMRPKQN